MIQIGIIGGGASGMAAAISAARRNPSARIIIFEKKDRLGKKIYATGNGRCNLTNHHIEPTYYYGGHRGMIDQILASYGCREALEFFSSLGLTTKSRGDYVYPRSDQASSVVHVLEREIRRRHITVLTDTAIQSMEKRNSGFILKTGQEKYKADKVILACGGKASPALGSDGSGYTLAKSMGHTITPVVPSLVQLKARKHPYKKAAGVRTSARVTAVVNGHEAGSDTGELQITAYGISGIPVFQISRFIGKAIYEKQDARVRIDFVPELCLDEWNQLLLRQKKTCSGMQAQELLNGIFPDKLISCLLEQSGINPNVNLARLHNFQIEQLAGLCKSSTVVIHETNGFEQAQVCAGGVETCELDPLTLESRLVKGLYITGELLDVDGICGGYNLHWAWATGCLAGAHASDKA